MNYKHLVYLCSLFLFSLACHNNKSYIPQHGDFLFQDLDCGPLCDAIESVTQSYADYHFSHLGLVYRRADDSLFVIEAIGDEVTLTPYDKFLSRSLNDVGQPKVIAMRSNLSKSLIQEAVKLALKEVGKSYDDYFMPENGKWYCSELIAYAFNQAARKQIFKDSPMTFKTLGTDSIHPAWSEYFQNINARVPEGLPGCNPGSMSRSDYLRPVYAFYQN